MSTSSIIRDLSYSLSPQIAYSYGMCASATGDLYVLRSHTIIRVSPDGTSEIYSGQTKEGSKFLDGRREEALYNHPYGIFEDSIGTLFVADTSNHRLRIVGKEMVRTYAGGATARELRDGPRLLAAFNCPRQMNESNGHYLVTDIWNHLIRIINIATGYVSTIGSLPDKKFLFDRPWGIAMVQPDIFLSTDYDGACIKMTRIQYQSPSTSEIETIPFAGFSVAVPCAVATISLPQTNNSEKFMKPSGIVNVPGRNRAFIADIAKHSILQIDFEIPSLDSFNPTLKNIDKSSISNAYGQVSMLPPIETESIKNSFASVSDLCLTSDGRLCWVQEKTGIVTMRPGVGPDTRKFKIQLSSIWNSNENLDESFSWTCSDNISFLLHRSVLNIWCLVEDRLHPLKACPSNISEPFFKFLYGDVPDLSLASEQDAIIYLARLTCASSLLNVNSISEWAMFCFLNIFDGTAHPRQLMIHLFHNIAGITSDITLLLDTLRFLIVHKGWTHENPNGAESESEDVITLFKTILRPYVSSQVTPIVPTLFKGIIVSHPSAHMEHSLSRLFNEIFSPPTSQYPSNHIFTLLTEADGTQFFVHDWILCARWPYFMKVLNSGLLESRERSFTFPASVSSSILKQLLEYIYTGKASLDETTEELAEFVNGDDSILFGIRSLTSFDDVTPSFQHLATVCFRYKAFKPIQP
jgi:hypothetical protein